MAKQKMTVPDFRKFKEEGRKFAYVTAYDYTTASIVNDSDVEVILVGDSLGMIMLGYDTTVGVTLDDMIHHIRHYMCHHSHHYNYNCSFHHTRNNCSSSQSYTTHCSFRHNQCQIHASDSSHD